VEARVLVEKRRSRVRVAELQVVPGRVVDAGCWPSVEEQCLFVDLEPVPASADPVGFSATAKAVPFA
jgi:hypothetical protein